MHMVEFECTWTVFIYSVKALKWKKSMKTQFCTEVFLKKRLWKMSWNGFVEKIYMDVMGMQMLQIIQIWVLPGNSRNQSKYSWACKWQKAKHRKGNSLTESKNRFWRSSVALIRWNFNAILLSNNFLQKKRSIETLVEEIRLMVA